MNKHFKKLIESRENSNEFFTRPWQVPNKRQSVKLEIWTQVGQTCIHFFIIVFSILEGA